MGILNTAIKIATMVLQDTVSMLYCECGCCGTRRFDVQRRNGKDSFSELSLRDVYGSLCDDCYSILKESEEPPFSSDN